LCYRILIVASDPRYRGDDLPQLVHLPRGHHRLRQDSSHLRVQASRVLPIAVSRSAFPHSSTDGSGLLAVIDALGSSTWRADVAALWIAFVEDTTSTYFHVTHGKTILCKNRLHMFISISHSQHVNLYVFQGSGSQQEAGTGYDFVDAITCLTFGKH
jgi:hypothetical protein